jgi:hypothetical protein
MTVMTGPEEKKQEEENSDSGGAAEQGREPEESGRAEGAESADTVEGEEKKGGDELPEDIELPKASFSSLILMLSTTALGYLAEIEKAEPKKKSILTKLARHTVDTIQVLDEKTKGNLDRDEQELVNRVLTDLRLQCIRYSA